MRTAFEQAAGRVRADPVILGAALQATVTIAAILLQLPLRKRRSRLLHILSFAIALAAAAGITALFALTLQVVLRGGPRVPVRTLDFLLRFARRDALWTLVREIPALVWRAVGVSGLVALYLYALLLVLLTPAVQVPAPTPTPVSPKRVKRVNLDTSVVARNSSENSVFDFNRVWLNVALLIVLLIGISAFSGVVIGSRSPILDKVAVSASEANKKAERTVQVKVTDVSECVCARWPKCIPGEAGKRAKCAFIFGNASEQSMFQCLTGVKKITRADEATIVHALDDRCASGPNGRIVATTFSAVLVGTQFLLLIMLAVMAVLRWPLMLTASFVLSAYLVFAVALSATLSFLISLDGGRINQTYGLKLNSLFLATGTGPVALRLARITVAFMFCQIAMSLVASATEWRRISWTLSMYSILHLKPNNDTYDHHTLEQNAGPSFA